MRVVHANYRLSDLTSRSFVINMYFIHAHTYAWFPILSDAFFYNLFLCIRDSLTTHIRIVLINWFSLIPIKISCNNFNHPITITFLLYILCMNKSEIEIYKAQNNFIIKVFVLLKSICPFCIIACWTFVLDRARFSVCYLPLVYVHILK